MIGSAVFSWVSMPSTIPDIRTAAEYIRKSLSADGEPGNGAGVEGATRVTIHTPLIHLSKSEIVKLGARVGVDFSLTHTSTIRTAQGGPAAIAIPVCFAARDLSRRASPIRCEYPA